MKLIQLTPLVPLFAVWLAAPLNSQGQNLVLNPGFEAGYAGFTTDYALYAGGGIGQNRYVVTNNPHSVEGTWISSGDHTSGSGQMLVVDGSTNAGRVFWRQTVSVTTNTMHVFSTWALKVESQSPPILYFTINGAQQGTFHVLPMMPSGWQGYGVRWNSGVTNSALLELRLQSTASGGNNLAIDDIVFSRYTNFPSPTATIESAAQIGWLSSPGVPYQVQWRSAFDTNVVWQSLGNPVTGNGATLYTCDPLGTNERRFYRVVLSP